MEGEQKRDQEERRQKEKPKKLWDIYVESKSKGHKWTTIKRAKTKWWMKKNKGVFQGTLWKLIFPVDSASPVLQPTTFSSSVSLVLFHVTDGWHAEGSGYAILRDDESQMSHCIQEQDKHLTWHFTFSHRFLRHPDCRMTGWVLQANPWTRERWSSPLPCFSEDDLRRTLYFHFLELWVVLISRSLVPKCFVELNSLKSLFLLRKLFDLEN